MRIIDTSTFEPQTQNESDWLYNALDVCVTLEVLNAIHPQLDNTSATTYSFSRDMQGPILEMTTRGLRVDLRRRAEVLKQCKTDIALIADQLDHIIRDGIGIPWRTPTDLTKPASWRSTSDLQHLFYNVLGFTPIKQRRGDGKYTVSTNRAALEKLSANMRAEPLCNRILLLHDLDKKRQRLEANLDSDGRERTNFNIAGTNTGRLSSSLSDFGTGGNQQNLDQDLREIYIPDPGMKFANFDLEQSDSRNVGAMCWHLFVEKFGEKWAGSYLKACESKDLHTTVARMTFPDLDWGPEDNWRKVADQLYYRNDSYRQGCKKLGHATNFDGQARGLAERIKINRKLVEAFQKEYFTVFPCVKERIEWVKRELINSATITNLFGMRRIFFGRPDAGETQREAIAFEPQSMTAREINQGILNIFRARGDLPIWLHCQVHDSLLIQFPEDREAEIIPWTLNQMKVPLILACGREFSVPVEAKTGWNWGDWSEKNPRGLKKWVG